MNPQKKLKTYNITYRPDPDNRYNDVTVTYKADSIEEAKLKEVRNREETLNKNLQRLR